ncbi:MAG: hypothetical protein IMZ62_00140 [Chloroflexi bacterium]|jgi:hypothetical protein|nr:hypothetical protein [Chloroflexota bacterium]
MEEFIPELQSGKDTCFSPFETMLSIAVMMLLELAWLIFTKVRRAGKARRT